MEGIQIKKRFSWTKRLLLLWITLHIIGHCILGMGITKICGISMASTFNNGEYVLVAAVRDCTALRRGDVITFTPEADSNMTYIKRIVALPGETVEARSNAVYVDGKEISFWLGTGSWGPIIVPSNAVFVLGDNRAVSCDSRVLGCIPFQQICAKVIGKSVILS